MALNPNAMTNVAALRAWLCDSAAEQTDGRLADAPLEALINRASAAVEAWCDRQLIAPPAPAVRFFDGDDSCRLILPEWPVAELVELQVDGETISARVGPLSDGYVLRAPEAWIELVGDHFHRGVQNVQVTARLGYDPAQAATDARHRRALDTLEQACLRLCADWFSQPPTSIAGDAKPIVPVEVRGLLAPYRRLGA